MYDPSQYVAIPGLITLCKENATYLYPDHAPLSVVTYTSEVCLQCRNKGKGPHHQTAALVSASVPSFRIASTGHFTEEAPALYQLLEGLQGLVTRKFEKLREQAKQAQTTEEAQASSSRSGHKIAVTGMPSEKDAPPSYEVAKQ